MLVLLGRPFMAILSAAVTFVEPTSFYLAKQLASAQNLCVMFLGSTKVICPLMLKCFVCLALVVLVHESGHVEGFGELRAVP